jgi:hypothetical protein
VSLAQELTLLGHTAEAVEGEKSQYDVVADGQLVFSKQEVGRHAEPGEVLEALKAL